MADENSNNNDNSSTNNDGPSRKRPAESDAPICRDFLRNACTRGSACKFNHPQDVNPNTKEVEFCHDFQNRGNCRRINCKYVHGTAEEERIYNETGVLPHGLQPNPPEALPICKDFMNGMCTRPHCKFRHIDAGRPFAGPPSHPPRPMGGPPLPPPPPAMFDKRPRLDYDIARMEYADRMRMLDDENMFLRRRLADREDEIVGLRRRLLTLEGENESLQRKLISEPQTAQLKKQVADLASMNEILLEQNARLKLNAGNDSGIGSYGQNSMSTAVPVSSGVTTAQNYLDQLDQKYSYGQSGSASHGGGGIRYM